MGDKRLGPFLYDNIDVPNPSAIPYNKEQKPRSLDWKVITSILLFSTILLIGLFVYVTKSLHNRAEYGDRLANILLQLLNISVIFAIIGLLFGATYTVVQWLRSWAYRKGFFSLNDGLHYNIFAANTRNYDDLFEQFALRMYDVMEERARQSLYSGVTTLTKDESKHIHMKKDGKEIPEGDTVDEELPITLSLDTERQDE